MGQMVFLPATRAEANALQRSGTASGDLVGTTATPALLRANDLDPSMLEDADYAALQCAGVMALTRVDDADPLRLVLAAELSPQQLAPDLDDPYGGVVVHNLQWSDVQALFSDEEQAARAVADARSVATGRTVDDAVELPAVQALLDDHDLLWFAPEELERLP
jgi:hypothetical protein